MVDSIINDDLRSVSESLLQLHDQLNLIYELYQTSYITNRSELLRTIASLGSRLVGTEHCFIYERISKYSTYKLVASFPDRYLVPESLEVSNETIQELVAWQRSKVINNWNNVSENLMVFSSIFKHNAATIIAPVVYDGSLVGFILFVEPKNSVKRELFTNELSTVESKISEIVANAVTNAFGVYKLRSIEQKFVDRRKDIEAAAHIQRMLLPDAESVPKTKNFDISYGYMGVQEIIGDFTYFNDSSDPLIVVVGDIMGHGAQAGMFLSLVYHMLQEFMSNGIRVPSKIIRLINSKLYKILSLTNRLLSILVVAVHEDGKISYCSAGHPLPVFIHNRKYIDVSEATAPIIGAVEDINKYCMESSVKLSSGDLLLLYTDGIIDSVSTDGVMFGLDRLIQYAIDRIDDTAKNITDSLIGTVKDWCEPEIITDDKTLIVLKRN